MTGARELTPFARFAPGTPVLYKPFTRKELAAVVAKALN